MITQTTNNNMTSSTAMFPRRVSFDLSHNTVHILPTSEQCKKAAKERHREEWQRKNLNEDILNEDIIQEIQEINNNHHLDAIQEEEAAIKSCLKKPTPTNEKKLNNDKRRNRSISRNTINVHSAVLAN